jgi:hypothetical protein
MIISYLGSLRAKSKEAFLHAVDRDWDKVEAEVKELRLQYMKHYRLLRVIKKYLKENGLS